MKSICLYFQAHQPYYLKNYRFFNIGLDHHYANDFMDRSNIERITRESYIPMNNLLLKVIHKYGDKINVSFSLSGTLFRQLKDYAPEVIDSFRALARSGSVEFVAEPDAFSFASILAPEEYKRQVIANVEMIRQEFGQEPKTFVNTELRYSNTACRLAAEMGFETVLIEGSREILGWRSPNLVHSNMVPGLKLLTRNDALSGDVAFGFSEKLNLNADSYIEYILSNEQPGSVMNLFMDYETFGDYQRKESGIFSFVEHFLQKVAKHKELEFLTPSGIAAKYEPDGMLEDPHIVSWNYSETALGTWLGNDMQKEAFNKLYSVREKMLRLDDRDMYGAWEVLQPLDNFFNMSRHHTSGNGVHRYTNPFDSPYVAFINYMNILNDFIIQVNKRYEQIAQ